MSPSHASKNVFLTITSKLFKSHKVKFSKNQTLLQNKLIFSTTLREGLAMPCANYTIMGFSINSTLIPNCFVTYKIMNEFVILELNMQLTISLFIL